MATALHPIGTWIFQLFGTATTTVLEIVLKMRYSEAHIYEKLKNALDATHLKVEDMSDGCGAKFDVVVVSPKFEGKSLLDRQRLVNSILEEEMKTIHALTQKTYTPEQWNKILAQPK